MVGVVLLQATLIKYAKISNTLIDSLFWHSTNISKSLFQFFTFMFFMYIYRVILGGFPPSGPFSPADRKQRGILGVVVFPVFTCSCFCSFFSLAWQNETEKISVFSNREREGYGCVVHLVDVPSWRNVLNMLMSEVRTLCSSWFFS